MLEAAARLEPAASCVTGRRSNQLNYAAALQIPTITVRFFPCQWRPKCSRVCRDRAKVCWVFQVAVKPATR
jgi:hypothetical protein